MFGKLTLLYLGGSNKLLLPNAFKNYRNLHSCRRVLSAQTGNNSNDSAPKFTADETGRNNESGSWKKLWNRNVIAAYVLLSGAGIVAYQYKKKQDWKVLSPVVNAATADTQKLSKRQKYSFFADVVDIAAPAVVYIEVKDMRRFDYFSGLPFTASNGSGFIVDPNGLILTNAHVVINKPHTTVHVKLQDGRTFPGRVESVDPVSDLATVRINCSKLPTMKLGTSSDLRAGEWVVALGSPLALSNTVTAGVVSSTQRASKDLGLKGKDINYIQTDAAITFGNSGGPLINLDGEAIGVNSMKVTAGISFAIPIDYVKNFLEECNASRNRKSPSQTSTRRYMGITMLTLTDGILMELRQRSHTIPAEVKHGVLVWKVILGSPAHVGGLEPGDIITTINGKQVHNTSDIYTALSEKGSELNMSVYRGVQKIQVTVIPEENDA